MSQSAITKKSHIEAWAAFSNDIGQACYDILSEANIPKTERGFEDPKVLAIMLLSRCLSHLKAIYTLAEQGLVVEARALVRCCFENAFWIAALLADGDKFVKEMKEDDMWSVKSRGQLVLSKKPDLKPEVEDGLRARLRGINKSSPKLESLRPKDVAAKGLLVDGYLIYSQLSADSAHPTLTSLRRYKGKPEGTGDWVLDVVPTPSERELIQTWDWACNAMLGAMVALNQMLGGTRAGLRLGDLADRYHALTKSGTAS